MLAQKLQRWASIVVPALHFITNLSDASAQPLLDFDRDVLAFYSRPDIQAPVINLHYIDKDKISPGFFFLSPWHKPGLDSGPFIYDNEGELVWTGYASGATGNVHNFHVCNYRGTPHLCYFDGFQSNNRAHGHAVVMDSSYRVVDVIQTGGGRAPVDMHELNFVHGGNSVLVTFYEPTPWDLTYRRMFHSLGWILRAGFQEIEIGTGRVLFEWDALDHINIEDCLASFPAKEGKWKLHAWDFFHLNSVDKTKSGDYLISGRHTNSLYLISGVNGTILWQLGGSMSTFKMDGFKLGFQHHARLIQESKSTTTISLFNNGWDGRSPIIMDSSYGALIEIHHDKGTAKLLRTYEPIHPVLSKNQGSVDFVSGSTNVVVGWGNNAYVTEHLEDGTPILNLTVANNASTIYRVSKSDWHGMPANSPAIWTFAKDKYSKTAFYASWNGATQISFWRFYGAQTRLEQDSFAHIGTFKRQGFETKFVSTAFYAFTFAEAISLDGNSLANSSVVATYVPSSGMATFCNDEGCPLARFSDQGTHLPEPMTAISGGSESRFEESPPSSTLTCSSESKSTWIFGNSLATLVVFMLFLFNLVQFWSYVRGRLRRYGGYRKLILG